MLLAVYVFLFRQAGVIAACGVLALTEMVDRLDEDHQVAKALAEGIAPIAGMHFSW
jgi:threonine aldolase